MSPEITVRSPDRSFVTNMLYGGGAGAATASGSEAESESTGSGTPQEATAAARPKRAKEKDLFIMPSIVADPFRWEGATPGLSSCQPKAVAEAVPPHRSNGSFFDNACHDGSRGLVSLR